MSETLRPRRSVLYMPGANERALEKAKGIPADALILDLEDAVAPDAKADARVRVCAAVQSGEYGAKELTIRINGLGTEWHEADLAAAAAAGPDGIVVPKVNSAAEVAQLVDALEAAGAPARTKLWAMLETPVAMLHAAEIATASARLTVLVMGTNDLAKELHAEHVPGRAPLHYGLQACLLAARLAGKVILDGVYNDIKDDDGFRAECVQGSPVRLRRQDPDPPLPGRAVQRRLRPERGRDRVVARDHRRLRGGRGRGSGRRHRQRPHDREPPRRQRPARPGRGRRHRRPGLTAATPSAGWFSS